MERKRTILAAVSVCIVASLLFAGPAVMAHPHHGWYTVAPSGDVSGVMDTANIQQALDDAIAAGGGSTVLLEEGDYYICETLVGVNFDGTFKGAGAGLTVLHSIENFPVQDTAGLGVASPRLLMFHQDESSTSTKHHPYKIQLADFTVEIDQPTEVWLPEWGGFRAINPVDIYGVIDGDWSLDTISYFDVTAKNLEFLGDIGEVYGPFGVSIQNCLFIQGQWDPATFANEKISGKYRIENCYFENSLGSSVVPGQTVDSNIRIVRNTYVNVHLGPEMYDLYNSRAEVAFNDISLIDGGWYGIYLANGMYASSLEPGRAYIHHNHIEVPAMGNGIWIDDYLAVPGEVEGVSVFAHHNDIVLDGTGAWGIVGKGAQDVWLLRNTISGSGEAGILGGIFGDLATGWALVLNDVSDLEADVAAIWLGPGTSDWWVLQRGDDSTVLDEGSDNWLLLLT
ncbi:hypothetical protein EU546_03590 [Candidatus Thorarchaeota archaeon]|nr:MAG: hypothetical protein EU546_03590 [Candidatus Thorarchaeota archaeon]